MDGNMERDIGDLRARMAAVEVELHELRLDVREIRDTVVGFRGGWKAVSLLIGISATVGALAGKLLPYLGMARE